MKTVNIIIITILFIFSLNSYSQEFEWNVENTSSNPGERIVAIIDAGIIGTYDGVGIIGTITDNNGNWGYANPTLSRFTAYVKFSNTLSYGIIQEKQTSNIILRLRKISDSKIHLSAYLPNAHSSVRVNLKKVEGDPTVIIGNPLVNNNSGELLLDEPTYNSIYIENNGTGNIGIGTSNPDMKFTVKGSIHAEEVKVDLTVPGPDYVFNDEYNLISLEELQDYITTNKHLPNIPTAKEMELNGIKLGIMNMKLLEKIEELTLFTINQEKRINDLEVYNKKLTVLVEKLLKKKGEE